MNLTQRIQSVFANDSGKNPESNCFGTALFLAGILPKEQLIIINAAFKAYPEFDEAHPGIYLHDYLRQIEKPAANSLVACKYQGERDDYPSYRHMGFLIDEAGLHLAHRLESRGKPQKIGFMHFLATSDDAKPYEGGDVTLLYFVPTGRKLAFEQGRG